MNKALKIAMWIGLGIVFVFLAGFVTMKLWNWLMPSIFALRAITFVEALGLFALAKIFFGFGGKSSGSKKKWRWKYRMASKYDRMTPEERQRFKERLREKWCHPSAEKPDTGANSQANAQ
jgi:hypothetical protein